MRPLRTCTLLAAVVALAACTAPEDELTPFPVEKDTRTYPAGPYGVVVGKTIKNYSLNGFADYKHSKEMVSISLGDFYNPTGDDVFPADSPYGAGAPKPTALMINLSSGWCGPCQNEASTVLPERHAALRPTGAEFLLALADGNKTGIPATSNDLVNWDKKFKVDFPSVIDPTYTLASVFESDAYPGSMIIDTRTMRICRVAVSEQDPTDAQGGGEGFWKTVASVAADPNACGQ